MCWLRTLWVVVLLGVIALGATGARAAAPPDLKAAREHFELGERLYAVAKFDEALHAFTAAYEAAPLPDFLYNIGQCHRRLGHHDQAIFFFNGFLQRAHNQNVPEVEGFIRAEEEAKRREVSERPRMTPPLPLLPQDSAAIVTRPEPHRPLYKRWWFWTTLVGVAAVAGGATALGVTLSSHPVLPSGPLGTIDAR